MSPPSTLSHRAKHMKYSVNQASFADSTCWQQALWFSPSLLPLIFLALSQMLTAAFPHPLSVESKLLQLLLRWEGEDRAACTSEDWITTKRENTQSLSCLSKAGLCAHCYGNLKLFGDLMPSVKPVGCTGCEEFWGPRRYSFSPHHWTQTTTELASCCEAQALGFLETSFSGFFPYSSFCYNVHTLPVQKRQQKDKS